MADNSLKKGRYTKYSNKIGLYSNSKGSFIKNDTDVVLNFPFKDTVLEAGMSKEDVGREERFLHLEIDSKDIDTLEEPKVLTNFRYVDKDGEKPLTIDSDVEFFDKGGSLKQNLIIKGNNLLALHTLNNRVRGQVKLVYIDPPYYFSSNRAEDSFKYNPNFKLSSWLVFMRNRLELARELLAEDGSIFVQINYEAIGYLKVVMDEIFGNDNLLNMISVSTKSPSGFQTVNRGVFGANEYILAYGKSSKALLNKIYVEDEYDEAYSKYLTNPDEAYQEWKFEPIKLAVVKSKGYKTIEEFVEKFDKSILLKLIEEFAFENAESVFQLESIGNKAGKETVEARDMTKKNRDRVVEVVTSTGAKRYIVNGRQIAFYSEKIREIDGGKVPTRLLTDSWNDISWMGIGTEGGVSLKGGKKPEKLLQRILQLGSNKGDLVLDYHVGSGTTAAVAHKMGRRYIGIEQLDYAEDDTTVRLKNVIEGDQTGISKSFNWSGGGSFVYCELKKYNQEYVDRIMEANSLKELEDLYVDMRNNAFLKFWFDRKEFEKDENFRNLDIEKRKQKLIEVLDENQLYLNYADMGDTRHNVNDDEKALTDIFYGTKKN